MYNDVNSFISAIPFAAVIRYIYIYIFKSSVRGSTGISARAVVVKGTKNWLFGGIAKVR